MVFRASFSHSVQTPYVSKQDVLQMPPLRLRFLPEVLNGTSLMEMNRRIFRFEMQETRQYEHQALGQLSTQNPAENLLLTGILEFIPVTRRSCSFDCNPLDLHRGLSAALP
jgi:hypothetical protein